MHRIFSSSLCRHPAILASILVTFAVAGSATPITIPVSLGDSGIFTGFSGSFNHFNGPNVQFEGQDLTLDFNFSGQFVRLFPTSTFFFMNVVFGINAAPYPQSFAGSGYLTHENGDQLGPSVTLNISPGLQFPPGDVTGVQFGFQLGGVGSQAAPIISSSFPVDAYGLHLDLTLPNSPGFGFGKPFYDDDFFILNGNLFGIGPGAGDVPDDSDTFTFLALAFGVVIGSKRLLTAGRGLKSG